MEDRVRDLADEKQWAELVAKFDEAVRQLELPFRSPPPRRPWINVPTGDYL